jgi:sensor domain CHASE-containing protein
MASSEPLDEVTLMNLTRYVLWVLLALGSTSALAEGGAERSRQFWEAFREDQQRLHGQPDKALAERQRKTQQATEKLVKD